MRWIVVVLLLVTRVARADDGDGFFGVAVGPAVMVGGDLGARLTGAGIAARPRAGFRFDRWGFELTMLGSGLADRMHVIESPAVLTGSLAIAYYPVVTRTFQLLVHAGMGGGAISGSQVTQVPCRPPEECTTKTRSADVTYPGYAVELGITIQVHLGDGTTHPMLWLDVGTSLAQHQLDTGDTSGRFTLITLGIADALR